MQLIKPTVTLKNSFFEMVNSYIENNEHFYADMYKDGFSDFEKYVEKINNKPLGIGLNLEEVPYSVYWLTEDGGNEIKGVIRIRHKPILIHGNIGYDIHPKMRGKGYGKIILNVGLIKAKEIGLDKIHITCAKDNIASKKIIEAHGGRYKKTVTSEGVTYLQFII